MREENDDVLLMSRPGFEPLAPEEADDLRGGATKRKSGVKVGTCVGIGYACSSSGGVGVGGCWGIGYAWT